MDGDEASGRIHERAISTRSKNDEANRTENGVFS